MEPCALCDGMSREAALEFTSVRKGERVYFAVALCESCANRVEKHLKRVIPKRLMEFTKCAPGL